jgi:hypothetical protein
MPNMAERVAKYLNERPGAVFCDECVAKGVKTGHSLSRMLDVFSADYFRRSVARCDSCGRTKPGIVRYPLRH